MNNKNKKLLGNNISPRCEWCQNSLTESGRHFCRVKKSINSRGKCSKFDYNPVMRKIAQPINGGGFGQEDFSIE